MARLNTALVLILVITVPAIQADSTQRAAFSIDWTNMKMYVSGNAAIVQKDSGNAVGWQLEASREAHLNLLRNFIDGLRYLQVDAYRSAHDVLVGDLERNERIYQYWNTMTSGSIAYGERDVTVTRGIPFFGREGFVPILFDAGKDTGNFRTYEEYVYTASFSGLVIDARGMGRRPALSPRIFDQNHGLVYSADLMDRESFERWGAVQYTTDPLYTDHVDRVGDNPFRITAIDDAKLIDCDIAIFTEDAQILLQDSVTRDRLQEGRVIVIVDSL
jgi:hypothetical protein